MDACSQYNCLARVPFQTASAKTSCLNAAGTSVWYLCVCSQNISKKYPFYSPEGMHWSEAERRPSGGMKYVQMSPSMQGTGRFFHPNYRGCQQRTFPCTFLELRSLLSSCAASIGWILFLVRSVLPGVCLDVCRNFYKLVCLSEQSEHNTLCVFWVKLNLNLHLIFGGLWVPVKSYIFWASNQPSPILFW